MEGAGVEAWLVERLPRTNNALGPPPTSLNPDVVGHTYDVCSREVKAGG